MMFLLNLVVVRVRGEFKGNWPKRNNTGDLPSKTNRTITMQWLTLVCTNHAVYCCVLSARMTTIIIALNFRFVWNRWDSYREEVKVAVGSIRNKNSEISLSYNILADVVQTDVAQKDKNGKSQLFLYEVDLMLSVTYGLTRSHQQANKT